MQLEILDREQNAARATRDRIQRNRAYVIQLLATTATEFNLEFELPQEYVEPSPPPAGCGFWLEIADEDDNLLTRVTYSEVNRDQDHVPPAPREVSLLLNDFCVAHSIDLEFAVAAAA